MHHLTPSCIEAGLVPILMELQYIAIRGNKYVIALEMRTAIRIWIFERVVKCQHEMMCTGGSIVMAQFTCAYVH